MRPIDADRFLAELREMWIEMHSIRPHLKHPVTMRKIRRLLDKQPTLEVLLGDELKDPDVMGDLYLQALRNRILGR